MLRRKFLGFATLAGAGGLAAVGLEQSEKRTAVYRVRGFTCVTCAVGLEVMLRRENGVAGVRASYPEGLATIEFHPKVVSAVDLVGAIAAMGFAAEPVAGS